MKRSSLAIGLLALLSSTVAGASQRASTVPASYVAIRATGGLTAYDSTTGNPLRRLTSGENDMSPQVVDGGRTVYYTQYEGGGCEWSIWRIATAGGSAQLVRRRLSETVTIAVSRDGRMLAYETTAGRCSSAEVPTTLTVEDLVTGRIHRIRDAEPVESLAWSPDDRDLVVEGFGGARAGWGADVVKNIFSATNFQPHAQVPCPLHAPYCTEMSPEYDAAGALFFVAAIDPNFRHPCALSSCTSQTYVLTELRNGHATALAESIGIAGRVCYMTVDAAGDAAIYSVPHSPQGFETFRWTSGKVLPMERTVTEESW